MDGFNGEYAQAVVVSNDADFAGAMRYVRDDLGNYTATSGEAAWLCAPVRDPKDESPVENCPECGGPCVDFLVSAGLWICFACGWHDDYHHCSRCGALMSGDDVTCDSCFGYIVSRD